MSHLLSLIYISLCISGGAISGSGKAHPDTRQFVVVPHLPYVHEDASLSDFHFTLLTQIKEDVFFHIAISESTQDMRRVPQ